jgi:hypothetical protein
VRTTNGYTIQRYGKMYFELSETDQDAVVGALEKGEIPSFGDSDGGVFPTYNSYNPTNTVQAIIYWVAEHIKHETQNGGTLTHFTTRRQAVG